jgi:hypothetical protein
MEHSDLGKKLVELTREAATQPSSFKELKRMLDKAVLEDQSLASRISYILGHLAIESSPEEALFYAGKTILWSELEGMNSVMYAGGCFLKGISLVKLDRKEEALAYLLDAEEIFAKSTVKGTKPHAHCLMYIGKISNEESYVENSVKILGFREAEILSKSIENPLIECDL